MTPETWHYLENQFDNVTKRNKKKMNLISSDHTARLQAEKSDADINELFIKFKPVQMNYNDAYGQWLAAKGLYKGETDRLNNHFASLTSQKLKQWDVKVQNEFLEGTSDYIAIFPGGRGPFRNSSIDQKITEMKGLRDRLGSFPTLSALKDEVADFHQEIESARNVQKQKEEIVGQKSDELEQRRIETATEMYGNLGVLIKKFKETPANAARFFDLSLLISTAADEEDTFDGTIAAGQTANILSSGFVPETKFILTNSGTALLKFCTASSSSQSCQSAGVEVAPAESKIIGASDLGNAGNTFLNVTNLDTAKVGMWSVTIL